MIRHVAIVIAIGAVIALTVMLLQPHKEVTQSPYDTPKTVAQISYIDDVKPITDSRCVVCHACYDAPCQLKLGAFEGIARGSSKDKVYQGSRLVAAELSRLFIDQIKITDWRDQGFHPVLNEEALTPENNKNNSLIVKMLEQKQANPLSGQKKLSDNFELDINREWQCPTIAEHEDYAQEFPLWGMPYALPGLAQEEHDTLVNWVIQGAATGINTVTDENSLAHIEKWEAFLNGDSKKQQLSARYLYEHFFIAHLYFGKSDEQESPVFYRLFRSSTPPGQPVDIIATRRPFSDPGVDRVFYRFVPVKQTLVDKTHMPFLLSDERLARYNDWFIDTDYEVNALPSYEPDVASNPFVAFQDIPVNARYRYMIDEAQYTIMQFIKGPVCRGQIALNVINDHFWVFFAEPSLEIAEHQSEFLREARETIDMPAEAQSNALPTNWVKYAEQEKDYLTVRSNYLNNTLNKTLPLDLSLIWDGDNSNDNVALTIFRHYDAATVVKGLVGDQPQTAWVLTYPLFERIHYLLVAGYDVYGNLGHQLNSRMYMDFLRMEGEFNFLNLLPKVERKKVWEEWYRGIVSPVEEYVASGHQLDGESRVTFKTEEPLSELYSLLRDHVSKARSTRHDLGNGFDTQRFLKEVNKLNQVNGVAASMLPQASFVRITSANGEETHFYTLLKNSAYSNISHIVAEEARRIPEEDTLTVGYGFMSSHPNAFFDLSLQQTDDFVQKIQNLESDADLEALFDQYGVRRTSNQFWPYSDSLHQYFKETQPVGFGFFDFNRLENH